MSDLTGDKVYKRLMDLSLLLEDIGSMGPLRMFLSGIDPKNPALTQLYNEVNAFTWRIEMLAEAAKKQH